MSLIKTQFLTPSMSYAGSITTSSVGNIYVQENSSALRMNVLNPAGGLLFTLSTLGDIYGSSCTDYANNKIYLAGVSSFGVLDISTNAFVSYSSAWLNGIAYNPLDGYVYATTNTGYIINKITPSTGASVTIFTSSNNNIQNETYSNFSGCAVDSNGFIYCVTRGIGYIYKFNTSGTLLGLFSILNSKYTNPWILTCDPTTNCLYTATIGGGIYKTNTFGISTLFFKTGKTNTIGFDNPRNQVVFVAQGPTINTVYISQPTTATLNIQRLNLLYYYKFDTDFLNYNAGTGVGVSDASAANVSISSSTTVLTAGSLLLPGTATQTFRLPNTTFVSGGITIALWMKCESIPTNSARLFDFGNGPSTNNFYVVFSTNGAMQLGFFTPSIGTANTYSLNYSVSNTNWHHYTIILSSTGGVTFYVDGDTIATGITQNIYPYLSQLTNCFIGKSPYVADGYLNAYINQFVLFNRAITANEVSYLSNNPANTTITNYASGITTLADSYTTTPSKITYGSSSNFKLYYSSQNLVSNAIYTLKTGSTVLDTQLYKGYLAPSSMGGVGPGTSAVDSSGNVWIDGLAGGGQSLYRFPSNLSSASRTIVSYPSTLVNFMAARMRYYNGILYYVSCGGWQENADQLGYFGAYRISDASFIYWKPSNYYSDIVIGNDGFGYAMSGVWSGPATHQWLVDKVNLQTFATTAFIAGTATLFEGSNDNGGGLYGITADSFDNFYILTKYGYLTKWNKSGTRLLSPTRLMYLSGYIQNGRFDCDKATNTLYIASGWNIYAVNTTSLTATIYFSVDTLVTALYPCIDNDARTLYCSTTGLFYRFDLNPSPTITFNVTLSVTENTLQITDPSGYNFGSPINIAGDYPCFLQGSKILRLNLDYDEEEYVAVESLRKGDLVKTATCGYKAVAFIGRATLHRPADDPDHKKRLYVFGKSNCPKVFKDLCITGEHCVLYRPADVSTEKLRQVREHMGDNFITEDFHRVPACLDEHATPYKGTGPVTIWHFALEHNNLHNNYAVYANGLLVETCSVHYLTKRSNMQLV